MIEKLSQIVRDSNAGDLQRTIMQFAVQYFSEVRTLNPLNYKLIRNNQWGTVYQAVDGTHYLKQFSGCTDDEEYHQLLKFNFACEGIIGLFVQHPDMVNTTACFTTDCMQGEPRQKPTIRVESVSGEQMYHETLFSRVELLAQYMLTTLNVLSCMHMYGFVMADISPENTIFDKETGAMTLIDLGSTLPVGFVSQTVSGRVYVPNYYQHPMKPGEFCFKSDKSDDIYRLGFIASAVLLETTIDHLAEEFECLDEAAVYQKLQARLKARSEVPPSLIDCIIKMISVDIPSRPSLSDVEAELRKYTNR